MSDTTLLALPRLEPAQAQKHVTVNEALQALDALVHLAALTRTLADPPPAPQDGARYLVAAGGTGAWAGRDGEVAAWQDGVWRFFVPREGWRIALADEGRTLVHRGGRWRETLVSDAAGAGPVVEVVSEDHALAAAAVSDTGPLVPARALLLGVTCLVSAPVAGATAFDVGVAGDPQRFGTGIGTALNAQLDAPMAPVPYAADTAIRFTAQGLDFTGGTLRVAAHILRLQIPDFL